MTAGKRFARAARLPGKRGASLMIRRSQPRRHSSSRTSRAGHAGLSPGTPRLHSRSVVLGRGLPQGSQTRSSCHGTRTHHDSATIALFRCARSGQGSSLTRSFAQRFSRYCSQPWAECERGLAAGAGCAQGAGIRLANRPCAPSAARRLRVDEHDATDRRWHPHRGPLPRDGVDVRHIALARGRGRWPVPIVTCARG